MIIKKAAPVISLFSLEITCERIVWVLLMIVCSCIVVRIGFHSIEMLHIISDLVSLFLAAGTSTGKEQTMFVSTQW